MASMFCIKVILINLKKKEKKGDLNKFNTRLFLI